MRGRAVMASGAAAGGEEPLPDGGGLVAKYRVPDLFQAEFAAAAGSIESGLYVSLVPNPSATIPASAADEIKNGTGQCCRVGQNSLCRCGHALSEHKPVKQPKRPSFIPPPSCARCKCRSYCYSPIFPEECGQWWLRARRDFNLMDWRKRVREMPHDYVCVGCNLKLSDHECLFETRADRLQRGAAVDEAYHPLRGVTMNDVAMAVDAISHK